MNTKNELVKVQTAAQLAARISGIGKDLRDVAVDLVSAIDTRPEIIAELEQEGVNRELLRRLERFGRGQMLPELVFATNAGTQRLIGLPLSEQASAMQHGVEVMEDDEKTVRKIPVISLTPAQSRLVFAKDHIRPLAEQRTIIRESAKKTKTVTPGVDFAIFKDHVVTRRPLTISRALLLQWLSQMT